MLSAGIPYLAWNRCTTFLKEPMEIITSMIEHRQLYTQCIQVNAGQVCV